ncbi:MAG TPA: DNA-processing protein DprA [Steroidobacteraceae bacterium]|nr:DNA-processing protein DprA [Steroidobacteraceae bacterium]
MDERRAFALLARAPGLRAGQLRAAVASIGELSRVAGGHGPAERQARDAAHFPVAARTFLERPPEALIDSDLRWLDATGGQLVACTSLEYPPLLRTLPRAPAVLWVLGVTGVLRASAVAIVGARRATPGGCATAHEFAAVFARAGVSVVSGLALGIDAASHSGALDAEGTTLAVCAHGLDRIYPKEHAELACRIRERGALLTRFAPGAAPRRAHFPERNRDLSGMSLCTLVIEAGRASGSLLTARAAAQQGRPVFAVPGSVRNPLAAGCHELIRGGARLVEQPWELLEAIRISFTEQKLKSVSPDPAARPDAAFALDKDSEILLDALGFEPVSINMLVERTGLPSGSVASLLLILELRGRVVPHPGGRYCRVP